MAVKMLKQMYPSNNFNNARTCITYQSRLIRTVEISRWTGHQIFRMKQKKISIFGLPKEYSENATIHGISYVFSASNAIEKILWYVFTAAALKLGLFSVKH